MIRVMFSVHVGDSLAHLMRTRLIAQHLSARGCQIAYSVPSKSLPLLRGYIDPSQVYCNDQCYSYALAPYVGDIRHSWAEYAISESRICESFKPHVIIGDSGYTACVYSRDIPILRIISRFYAEIECDSMISPYSLLQKWKIKQQFEGLINYSRGLAGVAKTFKYDDFAKLPSLLNGSSYFVDDAPTKYRRAGITMALSVPPKHVPNQKSCVVMFGTGFTNEKLEIASLVLRKIESKFERIYVAYGTKVQRDQLYHPANAVMEPVFNTLPTDVGFMICHGGMGALHVGIGLGIPIIVVPFQIEQLSNAHRLQEIGLGHNTGIFGRQGFQGLHEKIEIDWKTFDESLDNQIRGRAPQRPIIELQTNLLAPLVEEFVFSKAH